jgi:hypothetical protein
MLTEDAVKHHFVPFLKDFYRRRYEPESSAFSVELDNVSEEGIVADGLLRFNREDGSVFECAFEATSHDKIQEVKYGLNHYYFLWDCAAFGAAVAASAYVAAYAGRLEWLIGLKWAGNLGFLLGIGLIAFSFWFFLMKNWRKYRYIHAVEQFKRYEVDEQWVALADDVFPSPVDPYLLELKSQCVYNGFGLGIVAPDGAVRTLCAPTRLQHYGKNRAMAHWVTKQRWYRTAAQSTAAVRRVRPPDPIVAFWNQLTRPVRYLLLEPLKKNISRLADRHFNHSGTFYNRFMSGQGVQKWIFALALALVSPLFWRVLQHREDNVTELEALSEWRKQGNPEDQYGIEVDEEGPIPFGFKDEGRGIPKQRPVKKQPEVPTLTLSEENDTRPAKGASKKAEVEEEAVATIDLSGGAEEDTPPKAAAKPGSPAGRVERPVEAAASKTIKAAVKIKGCGDLTPGWIVQDNIFSSRENAERRLAALQEKKIKSALLKRSCIEKKATGYAVWLGTVYATEKAALSAASGFEKTLRQRKLMRNGVLVKRVE